MNGIAVIALMSILTTIAFVGEAYLKEYTMFPAICAIGTLLLICSELAERFA